jgi:copper chaperone CopZ
MTLTELTTPRPDATDARRIYLDVTGMSCVMCAGRVTKALNKIDGVKATVSFASKTATVEAETGISPAELCEAVRAAGYGAEPRDTAPEVTAEPPGPLRRRVGEAFDWLISR